MDTPASWVAEAVETLSLAGRVRRVDEPERSEVLARVTDAFLKRPDVRWWWEHLKVPAASWHTGDGFKHLPQLAPDAEAACWLIAGLEDDGKGVFHCAAALAAALIGECPYFEYAVVDPALRWMVIENHHDMLIATGDAMPRLERLRG